jgi:CBS domain-containing protein
MQCKEIMKTKVECLTPEETAQDAARKMRDMNVGFLPICDETGNVLGTVTDRDIVIRIVAEGLTSDVPLDQAMTNEVVACRPDDDVEEAQELMAKHKKSRILCIDDDGKLMGVISLSDIAQKQDSAGRTLRQVTQREAHA